MTNSHAQQPPKQGPALAEGLDPAGFGGVAEFAPGIVVTATATATGAQHRVAALITDHFDAVWRTLRRLGLSDADADDGAQQVFIVASQKLAQISDGRERAFVIGIAYKVAANSRRSLGRRPDEADQDEVAAAVCGAPNPEELLQKREARALMDRVMASMPLEARTVFVLYELEGMSTREIAESLDAPQGTVASRLRRAREIFIAETNRLRLQLRGDES